MRWPDFGIWGFCGRANLYEGMCAYSYGEMYALLSLSLCFIIFHGTLKAVNVGLAGRFQSVLTCLISTGLLNAVFSNHALNVKEEHLQFAVDL